MITIGTRLNVADNSGAKTVECIGFIGNSRERWASIGDVFVAVVKTAHSRGKIAKSAKCLALIVRTKSRYRRKDGSFISFDDNAVVLLDKSFLMVGSRVFGTVPRYELRQRAFLQILSLAEETR